eukprot:6174544-Pleurochrysis_carterae.AAC.1
MWIAHGQCAYNCTSSRSPTISNRRHRLFGSNVRVESLAPDAWQGLAPQSLQNNERSRGEGPSMQDRSIRECARPTASHHSFGCVARSELLEHSTMRKAPSPHFSRIFSFIRRYHELITVGCACMKHSRGPGEFLHAWSAAGDGLRGVLGMRRVLTCALRTALCVAHGVVFAAPDAAAWCRAVTLGYMAFCAPHRRTRRGHRSRSRAAAPAANRVFTICNSDSQTSLAKGCDKLRRGPLRNQSKRDAAHHSLWLDGSSCVHECDTRESVHSVRGLARDPGCVRQRGYPYVHAAPAGRACVGAWMITCVHKSSYVA